jgi:hypothetical protein
MPGLQRRRPVVRVIAGGTVVVAHAYVVIALLAHRTPAVPSLRDDTDVFVMIDLHPADSPAPARSIDPVTLKPGSAIFLELPAIETSLNEPSVDKPSENKIGASIDWSGAGARAAAGAAAEPGLAPRDLGALTHPEPRHRAARPFAWDKSQTERVTALPGAIHLRMGSHCEVVFAPLPIGGCSLGKIPARGDLFSEMSAAAEPGDWRDDSTLLNGR